MIAEERRGEKSRDLKLKWNKASPLLPPNPPIQLQLAMDMKSVLAYWNLVFFRPFHHGDSPPLQTSPQWAARGVAPQFPVRAESQ